MEIIRPRLVVLPGGKKAEADAEIEKGVGPITRLGLRSRFPQVTAGHWFWIVTAKVLLLTSLLYVLFG